MLVKKVPGTLHFTARAEGHSFDHAFMNLTHVVHSLYFGSKPTPRKYYALRKLHPMGLSPEWLDKMAGQMFFSDHPQHTHEHYLQVYCVCLFGLLFCVWWCLLCGVCLVCGFFVCMYGEGREDKSKQNRTQSITHSKQKNK